MFHTSSAYFLLLLLLVPYLLFAVLRGSRRTAIGFSSTQVAADLRPSWRQRLRWLPAALGVLGMVLMIVALARPQEGRKETVVDSEGIAIEMLVDRSGSMQAMDFEVEGKPVDRLTAIKDVAGRFVGGGEQLDGRHQDLVGLVTFAGQADGIVPPTLDHAFLTARLNETEIVSIRSEDGTAIGDAIGLAVEKLSDLSHDTDEEGAGSEIKSKVIILMTDGENNAGALDPLPAAELAESLGIKIYTVGVGTTGMAPVPVEDPYTGREVLRMVEVDIDEDTLRKVAEQTGGKYFRATDSDSLANIYEEIDQLEKSRVEARHLVDYRELAVEPTRMGAIAIPPVILLAMFCLMGQVLLGNTVLRQL